MQLSVGDTVVHPHHGTATVAAIEQQPFEGELRRYVVLRRPDDALTLKLPGGVCDDIGVRTVIDAGRVDDVIAVLEEAPSAPVSSWRKQHARNERRVHSGEAAEIAAAVRDLHARHERRGLATTDLRLYRDARERLIDEFAAALEVDTTDAEAMLDDALEGIAEAVAGDDPAGKPAA